MSVNRDYSVLAQEARFESAHRVLTELDQWKALGESIRERERELARLRWECAEADRVLGVKNTEVATLEAVKRRLSGELPDKERKAAEFISGMAVFYRSQAWDECPELEGVYVLYRESELIYIGESGNIRKRLKSHTFRGFTFVRYLEVLGGREEREKVESNLINACNPPENGWSGAGNAYYWDGTRTVRRNSADG